jgi:hypothetical protein
MHDGGFGMSEFVLVNLFVLLFRTVMVLVGFAFAYLGYRLFQSGVYEKAGELKAAWGDRNLALKQAAPGIFFALFGVIVVGISIVRGTDLRSTDVPVRTTTGSELASKSPDIAHSPKEVTQGTVNEKFGLGVDEASEDQARPVIETDGLNELLDQLLANGKNDKEVVDSLYLATLARFPNPAESKATSDALSQNGREKKDVYADILWMLTETREFQSHSALMKERFGKPGASK